MSEILKDSGVFAICFTLSFLVTWTLVRKKRHD